MNKQAKEQIVREIREQLQQEPALSDPTKILVGVENRGGLFKKRPVVTVDGKVKDAIESRKAAQVIESRLGANVEVDNRLTVNSA